MRLVLSLMVAVAAAALLAVAVSAQDTPGWSEPDLFASAGCNNPDCNCLDCKCGDCTCTKEDSVATDDAEPAKQCDNADCKCDNCECEDCVCETRVPSLTASDFLSSVDGRLQALSAATEKQLEMAAKMQSAFNSVTAKQAELNARIDTAMVDKEALASSIKELEVVDDDIYRRLEVAEEKLQSMLTREDVVTILEEELPRLMIKLNITGQEKEVELTVPTPVPDAAPDAVTKTTSGDNMVTVPGFRGTYAVPTGGRISAIQGSDGRWYKVEDTERGVYNGTPYYSACAGNYQMVATSCEGGACVQVYERPRSYPVRTWRSRVNRFAASNCASCRQ